MVSLPPDLAAGLVDRAARPDFGRFEAQLRSSNYCAHPVRLKGHVETCDRNGHRTRIWSTDGEPDGILRKTCGNRREAQCPSCAEVYREDSRQLIAAGLRGGKGIPDTVTEHPAVFATLTAPSFGVVHTQRWGRDGRPLPCRPRRDAPVCPHGLALSCGAVHCDEDRCLGEPLCLECFDHTGALLWNNALGALWRYTTIYLKRNLARECAMTQKALGELVRPAYIKVGEYQRRGLVHLHLVARLDKAMPAYRKGEIRPPSPQFTVQLLEDALRATVEQVTAPLPEELGGGRVGWGKQLEVEQITTGERRGRIASYLSKYTTKSTELAGGVLHRVKRNQIATLAVREHVRRYLHQAFVLDEQFKANTPVEAPVAGVVGPAAQTAADPAALAYRARQAMALDERVRVLLTDDAGEHVGRIRCCTLTPSGTQRLTLDTGAVVDLDRVRVISTAPHDEPRKRRVDPRLAACAHQLGYRGHCLTKSRHYSTTFKALRQAREQHVLGKLAGSDDPRQRALAEAVREERISSFVYAGRGHVTTADAFLAASAAARAREHRRLAWEERGMDVDRGGRA